MGRSRETAVDDIASLRFGVRKDQPGRMITDYHTAHIPPKAHNKDGAYVTYRQYLSDAIFLVALEGKKEQLEEIRDALINPVYPPYLGRRSCPPSGRMFLEIVEGDVEKVLNEYEWQASDWYKKKMPKFISLEIVTDSISRETQVWDFPTSFNRNHRQFKNRFVKHWWTPQMIENSLGKNPIDTNHDAISTLREE